MARSRQKHLLANYHLAPRLWAAPAGAMVALLAALLLVRLKKAGAAFVCTALAIVAGVGAIAAGLFPTLLPDSSQPPRSLTITNAASTDYTLMIMLVIAAIGVPIVLLYTIWIYWTFRHKTDVEPVY